MKNIIDNQDPLFSNLKFDTEEDYIDDVDLTKFKPSAQLIESMNALNEYFMGV